MQQASAGVQRLVEEARISTPWSGRLIQRLSSALRSRAERAQQHVERARKLRRARRWPDAVAAYRQALELTPGRAAWQYELGTALQRAGDWRAAAEAFAAGANLAPRRPAWRLRQARCLVRAGEPQAAITAYRDAVARAPRRAAWHYEFGWLLERTDGLQAAEVEYAAGLRAEPAAQPRHTEMLARTAWRFPRRRGYMDFVAAHIDEIREGVQADEQPLTDPKIYFYWDQGLANSPPVVRRCYEELRRWHGADELVLLDDQVWGELEIPVYARARLEHRPIQGAALLRLELLSRHGGVWLDATCLTRRPVLPLLGELAPTGFFAFQRAPLVPSTWMLVSTPGNYLVTMWRQALYTYWQHHDRLLDYYVLGPLFEALCVLDPPFREQWEASPRLSTNTPHAFRHEWREPYEPSRYAQLLDGCFVHKLTYKDGSVDTAPGSMIERIIEQGPPD